jgi:hypothetical protein
MTAKETVRLLPKPRALRLVPAPSGAQVRLPVPCGLAAWSDADDADIAIVLTRGEADLPTLEETVAQLPEPETLPEGRLVVVLGELRPSTSLTARLERWLGSTKARVPRALRTSALLARGYERLGAGKDQVGHDLAWGYVRSRPSPAP